MKILKSKEICVQCTFKFDNFCLLNVKIIFEIARKSANFNS